MILGHSMGAAIALQTFGYVDGWQLGEGGTVLNNHHNRKATYFKMHLLLNILIFQPASHVGPEARRSLQGDRVTMQGLPG